MTFIVKHSETPMKTNGKLGQSINAGNMMVI